MANHKILWFHRISSQVVRSSKETVPLQDQTLKENCPTDAKKRSNTGTRKGSKEMNENTLALPKKRKRKNVSCPEIVSNNGDKAKKKKENQNEKKVLRDA